MTIEELKKIPEMRLATRLFEEAVCDLEIGGHDVRVFSTAMLRGAIELHAEINGTENTKIAAKTMAGDLAPKYNRFGACQ